MQGEQGWRSERSCEGVAGPKDVHGVRTRPSARARAGIGGGHSRTARWRRADREMMTAAMPAGSGARQRRETERDRTRLILRRLGFSEETCRVSKGGGPSDLVRAWQDHGTCTGCGHEALSAREISRRGRRGPLTFCGMATRRTQATRRGRSRAGEVVCKSETR